VLAPHSGVGVPRDADEDGGAWRHKNVVALFSGQRPPNMLIPKVPAGILRSLRQTSHGGSEALAADFPRNTGCDRYSCDDAAQAAARGDAPLATQDFDLREFDKLRVVAIGKAAMRWDGLRWCSRLFLRFEGEVSPPTLPVKLCPA